MDALFSEFQNLLSTENQNTNLFVRFYDRAVKTDKIENGIPVFDNQTFVEIRMKNNNNEVIDQPADKDKIQRFPVEYNRYLLQRQQKQQGAPLEQFAFLTLSQIQQLQHRGIFTVEKLSGLNKEQAEQMGVVREKELADKFLAMNKNNSVLLEFEKKEAGFQEEIAKLKAEIEQVKAEKEALRSEFEKKEAGFQEEIAKLKAEGQKNK